MKRLLLPLIGLIGLAGCGRDDGEEVAAAPDTNQIERLSTPPETVEDPQAGARLEPLTEQDIAAAGIGPSHCGFSSNGVLLLASNGSDTIAKIAGEVFHPVPSSPIGPSGGFFEDRGLSISVGRTEAGAVYDSAGGAPARATITNRRTRVQAELTGLWACRNLGDSGI